MISISVDDTRQILYALVQIRSAAAIFTNPFAKEIKKRNNYQRVDVYDLGAFDDEFSFVGSLTHIQFANMVAS